MFKNRLRIKSTPSALARSSMAREYPREWKDDLLPGPYLLTLEIIGRLSGISKSFAIVMLETGARPVEILSLCSGHSHPNGGILISSAKNSQDRIAYSPHFRSLLPKENIDPTFQPFRHYSYRRFYRAVMRTEVIKVGKPGVHVPVSRLFRQAHASVASYLSNGSLSVVAHTLGHKNSKNAAYYMRQEG